MTSGEKLADPQAFLKVIQDNKSTISISGFQRDVTPYVSLIRNRENLFFQHVADGDIPTLSNIFKPANIDPIKSWALISDRDRKIIWQYFDDLLRITIVSITKNNNLPLANRPPPPSENSQNSLPINKPPPRPSPQTQTPNNPLSSSSSSGPGPSPAIVSNTNIASPSPSPPSKTTRIINNNVNSSNPPSPLGLGLNSHKSGTPPNISPASSPSFKGLSSSPNIIPPSSPPHNTMANIPPLAPNSGSSSGAPSVSSPVAAPVGMVVTTQFMTPTYLAAIPTSRKSYTRDPKDTTGSPSPTNKPIPPSIPTSNTNLINSPNTNNALPSTNNSPAPAPGSILSARKASLTPLSTGLNNSLLSSNPVVRQQRLLSAYHAPRSRTLSASQANLLADCSKKGLSWHIVSPHQPNLFYPLANATPCPSLSKILEKINPALIDPNNNQSTSNSNFPRDVRNHALMISLFVSPSDSSGTRDRKSSDASPQSYDGTSMGWPSSHIQFLYREKVLIACAIDDIETIIATNPTTLQIVYKQHAKPLTINNNDTNNDEMDSMFEYISNVGKELPSTLVFTSPLDCEDVNFVLSLALSLNFPGFYYGQINLHKSSCERLVSKGVYEEIFLRLFSNRLLVYRNEEALFPTHIISLSSYAQPDKEAKDKEKEKEKEKEKSDKDPKTNPFVKNVSVKKDKERSLLVDNGLFRFPTVNDRDKWISALSSEHHSRCKLDTLCLSNDKEAKPTNTTENNNNFLKPNTPIKNSPNETIKPEKGILKRPTPSFKPIPSSPIPPSPNFNTLDEISILLPPPPLPPLNFDNSPAGNINATPNNNNNIGNNANKPPTPNNLNVNNANEGNSLSRIPPKVPSPALPSSNSASPSSSPFSSSESNNDASARPAPPTFILTMPASALTQALYARMNDDQTLFFTYLWRLHIHAILFSSNISTISDFFKLTPHSFFTSRSVLLKAVDTALDAYHIAIARSVNVLRNSRIVVNDTTEQSAASQIGFAFPGFDSQVFDVGRMAVVSPFNFFGCAGALAFSDSDFNGALQSKSVGKELMQSSPDVSELFESDPVEAKNVLTLSTLDILHNIHLASYLKSHNTQSKKFRLTSGDVIHWHNILSSSESEGNEKHCEAWANVAYVYNPPIQKIDLMLSVTPNSNPHNSTLNSNNMDEGFRILCSPLNFLLLIRRMIEIRESYLKTLCNAIVSWQNDHPTRPNKEAKAGDRALAMANLLDQAAIDENEIASMKGELPTIETVQQSLNSTTKTGTAAALTSFLTKRPEKEKLVKMGLLSPEGDAVSAPGSPASFNGNSLGSGSSPVSSGSSLKIGGGSPTFGPEKREAIKAVIGQIPLFHQRKMTAALNNNTL